ncbi:MAG: glycosyltransferase [Thiobacillus sp.]|uniref:glycosyltransferase n=1 Tax=Thiobacillus sp. TaxID=924 RepID=UPI0028949DA0|nr:glycosyltransferase [Thiobacillus sp.]MDT3705259.1 glycosyltransferase [Thiobacillus sp.]
MYCEKPEASSRIIILVRRLDQGGAQRQLIALALGLKASGRDVRVVLFYPGGAFEAELGSHGIPIYVPGKHGRWDTIGFLIRLAICLHRLQPDVVYSFMNVPNILAVVLRPFLAGTRIVWGVRASNMDLSRYDRLSRIAYGLERRLARFADSIIANSYAGKRHAIENGFPEGKMVVIPNGIDTKYFQFEAEGRRDVRMEWGIGEKEILVGLIARLDPMKDHPTFLEAASRIARVRDDVRFVCVGDGSADYVGLIKRQAVALGLANQLIWAGARDNMPSIYSALDIATSTSAFGEGFSNTIAEAMACCVPCVVTDVGDSAQIVGETGSVVAPADHSALAAAIQRLISLPPKERRALGEMCRARIMSEFGMDTLVQRTEHALGLA